MRRLASASIARVAIAIGLVATPAAAAPVEPSEWLQRYDADPRCPDQAAFRSALAERLEVPPDEAFDGLQMWIDIARDPHAAAWRARIEIRDATGVTTTRELEDASCSAVVHASSLLAALSQVSRPASAAAPEARAPAIESSSAPARIEDQPPANAGEAADDVAHFGAAALAVMQGALAPRMAFGVGIGAFVELPAQAAWQPWFQLAAVSLQSGLVPLARYSVRTEFDAVLLEATACPIRIGAGPRWSLRPCVDVGVGQLTASSTGQTLEGPLERRAPWLSVGPSLRADVAVYRRVHAAVALGANLPLARHEFYFDPDILAFRVPALGVRAAGSLALSF